MPSMRLKDFYKETVVKKLLAELGYHNVMEVPRIKKITLNMGEIGRAHV